MTEEQIALADAIQDAKVRIAGYEVHSEITTFETLRALDALYCNELFELDKGLSTSDQVYRSMMGWGANGALARVLPKTLVEGPFRLFRSTAKLQDLADDLLFSAGSIRVAERFQTWMHRGLLTATLRTLSDSLGGFTRILELRDTNNSLFSEEIGAEGIRWRSEQQTRTDRDIEHSVEIAHHEVLPNLQRRVERLDSWGMRYTTDRTIDDHFMNWAIVYLRRMVAQELLNTEDSIGGRTYNEYLGVMVALSARSQKHLCYSSILKSRYPHLDLRNLLTTFAFTDELVVGIAGQLDADTETISAILDHLVLAPENAQAHLQSDSPCWPPVVQASQGAYLLPLFGLEIAPFNFLLNELRNRYEADWFRLANRRERRWIDELNHLFAHRWQTNDRNVRLQRDRKDMTDLDYAIYDDINGELGIFQLKWQQQVGLDTRLTRNAGSNLIDEGNKWIAAVADWVNANGISALLDKLGFKAHPAPKLSLFVVARYSAYFSGFDTHDHRATWTDWGNFLRAHGENPAGGLMYLSQAINAFTQFNSQAGRRESIALPLADLAIVVNPTRTTP